MNCELQFGQVVVWCAHKSTWQACFTVSDSACHWVTSDVNTAEKRRDMKEVQLINRIGKNPLLKHIMRDHRKWLQPQEVSLLLLLFWIRFLTAFKRENKNYGVSPLWLAGNNPLLLFCASFFSKASKFSFLKIFNSIFEDKQKRAATVILITYQGWCFSFLLPLLINLLLGLLHIVWNARLHAGRTWKFRCAQRADKETWRGQLRSRRKDKS